MNCTCPPLFMKGGQKSCHGGQWTQVHVTLIRASPMLEVFVYTGGGGGGVGGGTNYTEGRADIEWSLVVLHQGHMHLQSKCTFNIGETFRANILKSIHRGRFELFWLPVTKHPWSKSGWLTSLVGKALGKMDNLICQHNCYTLLKSL